MIKAVKAKKHLGQHFLINEGIALDISNLITENQIKNVLEIGPGMGVLTKNLINVLALQIHALTKMHLSLLALMILLTILIAFLFLL